jgi:tetratricopeptide (TPR) repeat protein
LLLAAFLLVTAPVFADQDHQHGPTGLEKLGKVNFPTSCSAKAQPQFERAVAMLHSFWYEEAAKAFAQIASAEPSCAMAHWGFAMSKFHPLWSDFPTPEDLAKSKEGIAQARAAEKLTERERDYIEAIATYYEGLEPQYARDRAKAYSAAMEKLAAKYPQDAEASIFYALSLIGTASPTDKTYANQRKAGDIVEPLFMKQPDHPGLAHYVIHAYDYPPLAERGLKAARRYAQIAPDVPHALHMPSHIFIRLGLWNDAIASNRASAGAAVAYAKREKYGPTEAWDQELHALDYLVYAYMQIGHDPKEIVERAASITKFRPDGALTGQYALAAIPARYALERRRWSDAAALPTPDSKPFAASVTHWARAVGLARSGQPEKVPAELAALEKMRDALMKQNQDWANGVESMRLSAAAWTAHAQGRNDDAVKWMRAAADLEEQAEKHPITPGPVLPARELLGDLLLALGQPREALKEYEASLRLSPNRRNTLASASEAAEKSGQVALSKQYAQQLARIGLRTTAQGVVRPAAKKQ